MAKQNPAIGEPFNPWRRFNGVFVPLGLLVYPGVSDGAKLLYGRLGLYAGKGGECYASRVQMAKDMGLHKTTITRLLNELIKAGFIRRIRRGPGRPAVCEFLYHEALRSSEKISHEDARSQPQDAGIEDAGVQPQEAPLRTQVCDPEDSEVQHLEDAGVQPSYKEDKIPSYKIHKQGSSSSSGTDDEPDPESKKRKDPVSLNRSPEHAEHAWYEASKTIEQAAAIIRNSVPRFSPLQTQSIEVPTVIAILKHMTDLHDLQLWLDSAPGLHSSARTWGRLVTDAAHWPGRRGITIAVVERSVPVVETPSHFFETPTAPAREPPEKTETPMPYCQFCGRAGIRQAVHDAAMWEWCVCDFAEEVRAKQPDRVDEDNARVVKLRNRFNGTPEPAASPVPLPDVSAESEIQPS